jgi:cyclopropane-fatty-acyl-phospholipid synthase
MNVQVQMTKRRDAVPLTRDWIRDAERELPGAAVA